jgi:hypothetical protein
MAIIPKKRTPPNIDSTKKAVPTVQKTVEPPVLTKDISKLPKRKPIPPSRQAAPKQLTEVDTSEVLALINRRQRQIIVHSVIYYRMNNSLIGDLDFDKWGRELVELQRKYPKIAEQSIFWEDMKDFDATTGFHLADHPWGMKIAQSLVDSHNNYTSRNN